ncbi:hypothetical protein [Lysobacter sp. N42]|nr:hypothetical protein [Lysobacter sp. N42]
MEKTFQTTSYAAQYYTVLCARNEVRKQKSACDDSAGAFEKVSDES